MMNVNRENGTSHQTVVATFVGEQLKKWSMSCVGARRGELYGNISGA